MIDDNDEFREMLSESLRSEGYVVVGVSNGKDGVNRYREESADLIITDLNMPEKSGPELIFELQKDFPKVKIIAISGGTDNAEGYLKDITVFSDVRHVFSKPFDISEMLQVVKELVNE